VTGGHLAMANQIVVTNQALGEQNVALLRIAKWLHKPLSAAASRSILPNDFAEPGSPGISV
jgi:hypothetical protein